MFGAVQLYAVSKSAEVAIHNRLSVMGADRINRFRFSSRKTHAKSVYCCTSLVSNKRNLPSLSVLKSTLTQLSAVTHNNTKKSIIHWYLSNVSASVLKSVMQMALEITNRNRWNINGRSRTRSHLYT